MQQRSCSDYRTVLVLRLYVLYCRTSRKKFIYHIDLNNSSLTNVICRISQRKDFVSSSLLWKKPHYHFTRINSLGANRRRRVCVHTGGRVLRVSLTLQVGGLWLYPVLMRAAQLWILFSKSIKRANKSRAVTQRSQRAEQGCSFRTTGLSWWTLSGRR